MKNPKDPRHKTRMKLVELLYAQKVNPSTELPEEPEYKYDKELYQKIIDIISKHAEEIDKIIEEDTKRDLNSIKNIEYVILKIAVAESYFEQITPYKVAIDEGIELAREYGDESSAVFVSGALGAIFDKKK